MKALQSCPIRHGGSDGNDFFVPLAQLAHDRGKNIRVIGRRPGMGRDSRLNVKGLRPVESGRMPLRRPIPLSLLGQHMNHHRPLHSPGVTDYGCQGRNIVPIHGSQICDTHVLKKHPRNHQLLETALCPPDPVYGAVTPFGSLEGIVNSFL